MTDTDHALYRFYSADGVLLYVGITMDPGRRWKEHAADKPWWHEVATATIERFPTREGVEAGERAAILSEHPVHNFVHNMAERRRWERLGAIAWSSGFDDLVTPRSARISLARRRERTFIVAVILLFASSAIDLFVGEIPEMRGQAVSDTMWSNIAVVVMALMLGAYVPLRLRIHRISRAIGDPTGRVTGPSRTAPGGGSGAVL